MKFNKIIMTALAVYAFASCTTEDDIFKNQVFISASDFRQEVRVAVDEHVDEMKTAVSIAIAKPHTEEVSATFVAEPELLEHYRVAYYDPEVELLDSKYYDLGSDKALINQGDVASKSINFTFKNLTQLDYSKTYVLPVSMVCDQLPVLEKSSTMYYVIKQASLVNVVADMKNNRAWPEWADFQEVKELSQFTMECMLNCHAFNNKSSIETVMGVEDHFLIRIGDVLIPTNQIQIAGAYKDAATTYRKSVTDPSLQLKPDTWYHLAVTFDKGYVNVYLNGKLKVASDALHNLGEKTDPDTGEKTPVIFENVNFMVPHSEEDDGKPRCFWIGYSYDMDRSLDGMISEVRLWDKVLTAEEINAESHFYKLYNPEQDPSLLAYWKFNEGKGKAVKDYSMYQHDLAGQRDFVWYPVSLPAKAE